MNEWLAVFGNWIQSAIGSVALLLPPDSSLFQIVVAGCMLLLALLLSATPSRFALVRQLLFLATGIALLGLLLGVLKLLPDSSWVSAVVWPAGLLLAGGLLGKMALADRYAALRDARHDPRGRTDSTLLPFQQQAMDRLLEQASLAATPLILGLQANWGAGKSTTVEHFLKALDVWADRFVAVRLNVWEYEDQGDLQFGAMQALLAHPRVLQRYGWMNFPLWMLAREWGGLRFGAFKFAWGQNTVDANGNLHLPWQSRFERIVALQHLAGRRVVLVLDEVDRASAPATQAVLTLLTRSLALPGIVAVVPFVENVIRFKAFHPDMLVLDDLRDTVSGFLHEKWLEAGSLPEAGPYQGSDPRRSITQDRSLTFGVLAGKFMERADARTWSDYYLMMEEKYLRNRIYLSKPGSEDLLLFLQLPEVKIGFVAGFGEGKFRELLDWVGQNGEEDDSPLSNLDFHIRWLKGDLLKLLSAPVTPDLDPRFLLMLALAMGRR